MYKGASILLVGGAIGSFISVFVGAALGFFGGAIWTEMMKDEGRNERYPSGRVNYQSMRQKPMTEEEFKTFVEEATDMITEAITKAAEVPTPEN